MINSNQLTSFAIYPNIQVSGPQLAQFQNSYYLLGQRIRMEDIHGTIHEYGNDTVGRCQSHWHEILDYPVCQKSAFC